MFSKIVSGISREVALLGKSYRRNELALYALTGKLEMAMRDQLAYRLDRRFNRGRRALIAAREWERHDIALMDTATGLPKALIEIKSYVSVSDIFKGKSYFEADLIRDTGKAIKRVKEKEARGCRVFFLVLAAHPHKLPDALPEGVMKYERSVRNAFVKWKRPNDARRAMDRLMARKLGGARRIASGRIPAGTSEGARFSVLYWLYRA